MKIETYNKARPLVREIERLQSAIEYNAFNEDVVRMEVTRAFGAEYCDSIKTAVETMRVAIMGQLVAKLNKLQAELESLQDEPEEKKSE